jgi:3D (Asp-Asp-Asp) domain-containing protein
MASRFRSLVLVALLAAASCVTGPGPASRRAPPSPAHVPPAAHELEVTATAYNSLPAQGEGDPTLTASGRHLEPGMRALAVSPDLLEAGLDYGTHVHVEGLPGEWVVLDRMAPRWRRRIDVYMGEDRERALGFGERRLRIRWSAAD